MKTFYYAQHGPQGRSMDGITTVDLIDLTEPNAYLLTRVKTSTAYRNQGHAQRLMEEVLRDADHNGATIYIEVLASDPDVSHDRLIEWYKRLGFESDGVILMKREPKIA